MTGFEYVAAVGLIQEGMEEEGLRVIRAVRGRYGGARRNLFDEAECGHHYARAMASWTSPRCASLASGRTVSPPAGP